MDAKSTGCFLDVGGRTVGSIPPVKRFSFARHLFCLLNDVRDAVSLEAGAKSLEEFKSLWREKEKSE